jgi:hypothetical protein
VSTGASGLTWTLPTLATNAGAQLTLAVYPLSGAGPVIVNSAIVTSATPDPNGDDNYVTTSVAIGNPPSPQLAGSYVGTNHQFQFSITDSSLEPYVVQASTNLVNWVPVYTNPAPVATITSFTDTTTTNYPYRFYRVLLQ